MYYVCHGNGNRKYKNLFRHDQHVWGRQLSLFHSNGDMLFIDSDRIFYDDGHFCEEGSGTPQGVKLYILNFLYMVYQTIKLLELQEGT